MSSICGVYCIRCEVNNKLYIGSSADITRRWLEHERKLKRCKHPNKQLQEDYNRYGADSFSYLVLIKCSPECLTEYETFYVEKYNTMNADLGYNNYLPNAFNIKVPEYIPQGIQESNKIKCIETDEIFWNKSDICNNGKDYKKLKEHLEGKRQSYKGYHWRYVY